MAEELLLVLVFIVSSFIIGYSLVLLADLWVKDKPPKAEEGQAASSTFKQDAELVSQKNAKK